jgi:hypothetical protein
LLLLRRHGSATEVEYHLLLANNLKMIQLKDHAELARACDRAEMSADRDGSEAER